jgi:hypothetical protein
MTERQLAYWYVEQTFNGRTHAALIHDKNLSWPGSTTASVKKEQAYSRIIGLVGEQQTWTLDECRAFFNM